MPIVELILRQIIVSKGEEVDGVDDSDDTVEGKLSEFKRQKDELIVRIKQNVRETTQELQHLIGNYSQIIFVANQTFFF